MSALHDDVSAGLGIRIHRLDRSDFERIELRPGSGRLCEHSGHRNAESSHYNLSDHRAYLPTTRIENVSGTICPRAGRPPGGGAGGGVNSAVISISRFV